MTSTDWRVMTRTCSSLIFRRILGLNMKKFCFKNRSYGTKELGTNGFNLVIKILSFSMPPPLWRGGRIIFIFKKEDGMWAMKREEIEEIVVDFFKRLFSIRIIRIPCLFPWKRCFLNCQIRPWALLKHKWLMRKSEKFSMGVIKALGPDCLVTC